MARKQRAERKWKRRRELKSKVLTDIRQRLLADVGPYFEIVRCHRVGFWALVRMIFPIIEASASVVFPVKGKEKPPVRVLRELGFQYPNLVWEMYRHTLSHNDEMAIAVYRDRKIAWGISVGGGHVQENGRINVDARQLFDDLLAFLAAQARASGDTQAWVKESFRFNNAFARATRQEALRLGKK